MKSGLISVIIANKCACFHCAEQRIPTVSLPEFHHDSSTGFQAMHVCHLAHKTKILKDTSLPFCCVTLNLNLRSVSPVFLNQDLNSMVLVDALPPAMHPQCLPLLK